MSRKLSSPIAYGRTAEIYTWQNGQVLKLFYDWFQLENIEYERRISQAVHVSGLPVPSVGEIIREKDRNGLIYECVDGVSMLDMLSRKPWNIFRYARRMAELHAGMHASIIQVEIPKQREKIQEKISQVEILPAELQSKILTALEQMPDENRLCHGDFHPGNIMVTEQDEIIIDWIDSTLGSPLADLARTSTIILGSVDAGENQSLLMRVFVHLFHRAYLRRYFSLRSGGEREYSRWLPIVAAARLSENIKELEKWLIARAEMVS
ncbi:MAG: phosphotransferase [Anaerolineales bacterium]|nr:phosphotransferase [Anaerolineales bacterium]MCB9128097.1 phosphotransferase [Ardenticatenales bacterium]MCB9171810.1 phosphotransferase [Ardenticatenales bacterium]